MMPSWILLCLTADKKIALQNFVLFRESGIIREKFEPSLNSNDVSAKVEVSSKLPKKNTMRKNQK
jgi:hypothetical protein